MKGSTDLHERLGKMGLAETLAAMKKVEKWEVRPFQADSVIRHTEAAKWVEKLEGPNGEAEMRGAKRFLRDLIETHMDRIQSW